MANPDLGVPVGRRYLLNHFISNGSVYGAALTPIQIQHHYRVGTIGH
jgi:hypothetical protein